MEAIIKEMLNKEQSKALFEAECVFMFGKNVIPQYRIVELFGEEFAAWLIEHTGMERADGIWLIGGKDWNAAGHEFNEMIIYYLQSGFEYIVSEHNLKYLVEKHKQSEAGQLISAIKEKNRRELEKRDAEDERKRQERRAKRAAAKAKREAERKETEEI